MGYMVSRDDGWRMPDWLWERIEPLLPEPPSHPLGCHNPRVPDRNAMEAILLVLRTGMQWNALDVTGICSCSSAHRRFQEWRAAGVFAEIWRQGLLEHDEQVGIDWAVLEGGGVPVGLDHDGANRNDHKLLKGTLDSIPIERPKPTKRQPQGICLDKAYDNAEVRELVDGYELTPHIRARGAEIAEKVRTPGWHPRRWVVDASHSWLNRNRAILVRWSKKDENHLALLQLASGLIAFKKAHTAQLAGALPA